ncbi:MAG: AAA family ATPase [Polyangiaceae bacterium]
MAFDLAAEIVTIREQYNAGQWPQFLRAIALRGLRGWNGERIELKFPVTAIVGQNGTGKTTVLKAAASAYENADGRDSFFPSDFFQQTKWDELTNIDIEYEVQTGDATHTKRITKPSKRWTLPKKKLKRPVFYFDVGRTLPIDATVGYAKIAKTATAEVSSREISEEYRSWFSYMMGREYERARFAKSNVDTIKEVGLVTFASKEISQFHQGAGEDATLDLVLGLQSVPRYSLIVVDEAEASLHPKAQRRLVEFLLWLARHARVQVILSTHSAFVLEQLPPEARILLLRTRQGIEVVYGASADYALSQIDDKIHPEVDLFVEDHEAATWLREILRSKDRGRALLSRVSINPVGPDNVVRTLGSLANDRKLPRRSLAVLDGDKNPLPGALQLPGPDAPERKVFQDLRSKNWPGLPQRFSTGAGSLFAHLEDVMTLPDHHKWTEKLGDQVVMSKRAVWEGMVTEWAKSCCESQTVENYIDRIEELLNDGSRSPNGVV